MNKELTIKLYQEVAKAHRPREVKYWHCSAVAKCPRALYMERKGVPELPENKPGAGKVLRWASGHTIEGSVRPYLETVYPGMLSNVRFTNEELQLSGEFDGYHPDTKTLISVKSIHDFAMKTLDGTTGLKEDTGAVNARGNIVWGLKKEPYIHHQWQEHAYVLLLRDAQTKAKDQYEPGQIIYVADEFAQIPPQYIKPWKVKNITYVYITLGGLIACYTTPVSPGILKRVSDKVSYLNEHWKASKPPLCLCQEGQEMYDVQDRYCPYRTENGCCSETLLEPDDDPGTDAIYGGPANNGI